jgi:2-iminobutanoate/2-iminopropanoate deaminase
VLALAVLGFAWFVGQDSTPAYAAVEVLPLAQEAPTVEYLNPGRNFSQAVRVDGIVYLSGQLGTSRDGEQGIAAETTRAMAGIQAALEEHGSGMDRVIKCTVFLADIADFGAMNPAYVAAFPADKPVRSTVAVGGLVSGALVEIECVGAMK